MARFDPPDNPQPVGRNRGRRTESCWTLNRVLRRGLLLSCERCDWLAFHPIGELAQTIRCTRCGHRNELRQSRWRHPAHEPAWFYDLDQLVRDLLAHNGDLPLLAADRISQDKHRATLIAGGRIAIGEAKANNSISGSQIDKLAEAAAVVTADEVHLATAEQHWTEPTINTLRVALTRQYRPLGLRPPDIHQWTQLRGLDTAEQQEVPGAGSVAPH